MKKCIFWVLGLILLSACGRADTVAVFQEEFYFLAQGRHDTALLEMSFASDEMFQVLLEAYSDINFFGEFSRGNPERYNFYREQFYHLLTGDIETINMHIADFDMTREELERSTFYFFDITGNGSPNLAVGCFMRGAVLEYIADTNSFHDHGGFHTSWATIIGTGRKMQRHNSSSRATYTLMRFDNDMNFDTVSVSYIYAIPIKCENIIYSFDPVCEACDMCKKAEELDNWWQHVYLVAFEDYYFRVTNEQFEKLTADFFAAWDLAYELVKDVRFTFEELLEYLSQTVESAVPTIPYTATATDLTLLINGNFTTVTAQNIYGTNYFRLADLHHTLEGTLIPKQGLDLIADAEISQYIADGHMYLNLRQVADKLDLRIEWVATRNTIIIAEPEPYVLESIFIAEPLPGHIVEQITGSSFHAEAPFGYCHLAYLTITHIDFDGNRRLGSIIVAAQVAEEVLDIFREIYDGGFPIARMRLIDYYGADDYYSMADNNSVGFNFRFIANTQTLSRHAWGMAIDINPIQNPFIRGDIIWPVSGGEYLDRTDIRPGMIIPGDVVYRAFTSRGWVWGGHWRVPIDYHHFERR